MKELLFIPAAGLALALLGGCAPNMSPTVATTGLTAQQVLPGVIVGLQPVELSPSNVGGVAGAGAGGLAGSTLGDSTVTRALGAIVGAVGGAIAGHAAGNALTDQKGVEVTVRLADGSMVAVAQTYQKPRLHVDQHVQVIKGSGNHVRVLPLG
ncbi:MAG: hypothetical protein P8011_00130 [Acidihalobacter sp.]|uniref:glycine zipper domain-containing protein n=1 Tax=Acidihalobacter sp. TaxID=1872108 RepID=UPI00307DF0D6